MSNTQSTLRILERTNLAREIDAFLIDRRARALSPRTIDYYDEKLTLLRAHLQAQGIRAVESVTAPIVRRFMLELSKTHNPGGVHAVYKAVMLALLDTGLRASEFIGLSVGDVDMRTGAVMVRHGKGNKLRSVFLGSKSRRALVSYLRMRDKVGDVEPLFATIDGGRLHYSSLRDTVRWRAAKAGISPAPIPFRCHLSWLPLKQMALMAQMAQWHR